jgi:hypothetical protein
MFGVCVFLRQRFGVSKNQPKPNDGRREGEEKTGDPKSKRRGSMVWSGL